MTLLSLLAGAPPLSWLVELDDALDAAWDTTDPLLRGEGDDRRPADGTDGLCVEARRAAVGGRD